MISYKNAIIITLVISMPTILSIISCNHKQAHKGLKKTEHKTEKNVQADIEIEGFCMREAKKDKPDIWTLNSQKSRLFKASNLIECNNVHCQLIRNDQKIIELNSNKSIIDKQKKKVFLSGQTVGNFRELKILGKDINYNFSNQTIKTKSTLNCSYNNFKLMAQESFFDLKENRIEMSKGIKTEILNNLTSNNS